MSDGTSVRGDRWTRRRFLSAAGLGLLAAATPLTPSARADRRYPQAVAGSTDGARSFLSLPDLRPPVVEVTTPARMTAPGYVFAAPFKGSGQYGPLIFDNRGEPVWFRPTTKSTSMNFRVQRYRGEDVLTWWHGKVDNGYGGGTGVVLDSTYRQIAEVKAGNGYDSDLHEFVITSRNTALVAIYNALETDASPIGGPVDGRVVEGVVQEIDIASRRVLFEWHSLDHIGLDESLLPYGTATGAFDYLHLNSIAVDEADGHLLVSARHTSTVYKIDRRTGDVVWRLGGKRSDFAMGPGATFNFQHDARPHADGTITVFDNGAFSDDGPGEQYSRPLRLELDMVAMTASLARVFQAGERRRAIAMGDLQQLPDGGAFVGWGTAGPFTEFGPRGTVRFDAHFAASDLSYRVFRHPWVGRPRTRPDVVTRRTRSGTTSVHVSWNGATEVACWRLLAGPRGDLRPVRTAPRAGFETAFTVPRVHGFVAVEALDSHGRVLATSVPAHA